MKYLGKSKILIKSNIILYFCLKLQICLQFFIFHLYFCFNYNRPFSKWCHKYFRSASIIWNTFHKLHKNSFDCGLNFAETALLLLENVSSCGWITKISRKVHFYYNFLIKYLIKLLNKRQPSAVVICAICTTSLISFALKNFDSYPKPLL